MEKKATRSTKVEKPIEVEKKAKKTTKRVTPKNEIHSRMSKLETAYMEALNGKIKFGEVKSMFKKFHKEIKESKNN
jgi:hypothetical protein